MTQFNLIYINTKGLDFVSKIYKSVTELIGRTPIIELKNIEEKNSLKATVLAKLEYFNPAGSVKDRVAKAMIEDAEKRGEIGRAHV